MERTYLRVEWIHDIDDEPVLLYSELDRNRMELRKVEIYRSGRADRCDQQSWSGTTRLGVEPVPAMEETASDSQFLPVKITGQEFESVWKECGESE